MGQRGGDVIDQFLREKEKPIGESTSAVPLVQQLEQPDPIQALEQLPAAAVQPPVAAPVPGQPVPAAPVPTEAPQQILAPAPTALAAPAEGDLIDQFLQEQGRGQEIPITAEQIPTNKNETLSTGELFAFGMMRDPQAKADFLTRRGLTEEDIDTQTANSNLFGMSIDDAGATADLLASIAFSTIGEVGGGAIGFVAGLPTGPGAILTTAGGAVAGGAAGGATYELMRQQIVDMLAGSGTSGSDMAFEAITGALGPLLGPALKAAGKVGSKVAPRFLIKALNKLDAGRKKVLAGVTSMLTGANPRAMLGAFFQPNEVFKLSAKIRVKKSALVRGGEELIEEADKLASSINEGYRVGKENIKGLKNITFDNTIDVTREVPTKFLDEAGQPFMKEIAERKGGRLAEVAADFRDIPSAQDLLKMKKSEFVALFDWGKGDIGRAFEIIKKPTLDFNDFEILRGARNRAAKAAARGTDGASEARAFYNRLMSGNLVEGKAVMPGIDQLPTRGLNPQSLGEFKALNKKYSEGYKQLKKIDEVFPEEGGKGLSMRALGAVEKNVSDEIKNQAIVDAFREQSADMIAKFAPNNKLLEKYDILTSAFAAQKVFTKNLTGKAVTALAIGGGAGGIAAAAGASGEFSAGVGATLGLGALALGARGGFPRFDVGRAIQIGRGAGIGQAAARLGAPVVTPQAAEAQTLQGLQGPSPDPNLSRDIEFKEGSVIRPRLPSQR